MAPKPTLADLSDDERRNVEVRLVDFDQQWGPGLLPDRVRQVPLACSWRLAALAEMVKIDLEHQWALGNRLSLEMYLEQYPELGTPADVAADLIRADYAARCQFGDAAELDDYDRRFPGRADELRRVLGARPAVCPAPPLAAALAEFLKAPPLVPALPPAGEPVAVVDPARYDLKPMGSDTLLDKFLERAEPENAAAPTHGQARPGRAKPEPSEARRTPGSPGERRARWPKIVAAAAVVLLLGVGLYVGFNGTRGKARSGAGRGAAQTRLERETLTVQADPVDSHPSPPASKERGALAEVLAPRAQSPAVPGTPTALSPARTATAGTIPVEPSRSDTITCKVAKITMKRIPAGEFLMGAPAGEKDASGDEFPQHKVRITRPFYLGVTEVTQGQYREVTGMSPNSVRSSDDLPINEVSWLDAVKFCNELSRKEGLPPFYRADAGAVTVTDWRGAGYRLPTEAEWEYACRAGSTTRYSFGDDEAELGRYAWFQGNSGSQAHTVGTKAPNAFGLFDMHGNVWEWCWDGYKQGAYGTLPESDPSGFLGAPGHVDRGGGYSGYPPDVRTAIRGWLEPTTRLDLVGFRVARSEPGR